MATSTRLRIGHGLVDALAAQAERRGVTIHTRSAVRGEAGDIVQDTYLRLAIDRLRSARARRESYVGPWLPEPIVTDPAAPADPADVVAEAEQLSLALLVALERLNPVERAVFLLRDVFDLDYDEVADAVARAGELPPDRPARPRARRRARRRRPVTAEEEERVSTAFLLAATSGEVEPLMAVLAADANTYSDGGGVVNAARKVIYGAAKSARFVIGIQRKLGHVPEYALVRVNGEPRHLDQGPAGRGLRARGGDRRRPGGQPPRRQQPGEADPAQRSVSTRRLWIVPSSSPVPAIT